MTVHHSKGLCVIAFLAITIVALAAGCHRSRSTQEGAAAASNEVSRALIGKRITIRGKFLSLVKGTPYIVLDNHQEVYIEPRGSFTSEDTHSRMDGKLVEATGTLRLYHNPAPVDETRQREPDHFYFEAETTQLSLISPSSRKG